MKFNEESFKKALSECKIIRWQNIFKQVVKSYLKEEEKQLTLTSVGCSNKIDYKMAFELALKHINSKPLILDISKEETKTWDELIDFINKNEMH